MNDEEFRETVSGWMVSETYRRLRMVPATKAVEAAMHWPCSAKPASKSVRDHRWGLPSSRVQDGLHTDTRARPCPRHHDPRSRLAVYGPRQCSHGVGNLVRRQPGAGAARSRVNASEGSGPRYLVVSAFRALRRDIPGMLPRGGRKRPAAATTVQDLKPVARRAKLPLWLRSAALTGEHRKARLGEGRSSQHLPRRTARNY